MLIILFVCYVFCASLGALLIKTGGTGTSFEIASKLVSIQFNPLLLFGMILYIFSFILYIVLLQKANLSFIFPLCAGVTNILAVLMGAIILREKLQAPAIAGVVLVVIGVSLMSFTK